MSAPPAPKSETRRARRHLRVVDELDAELADRPRTRGDCIDGPRPCPWVACKYNLYLDITKGDGIKLAFPDLEPDEMPADRSCALDVADMGGGTLEDVATCLNVTRERARQIQDKARSRLHKRLLPHVDGDRWDIKGSAESTTGRPDNGRSLFGDDAPPDVSTRDSDEDEEAPGNADEPSVGIVRFLDASNDALTSTVWRLYERASRERLAGLPMPAVSRSSRDSSESPPPPTPPPSGEHPAMSDLPAHLEDTLRAFRQLENRDGRPPTAKEIARHLDDGTTAIAATARLLKLRKLGKLPAGRAGRKKSAEPKAQAKPTAKPAAQTAAALRDVDAISGDDDTKGGSPFVERMRLERDKYRAIADKLDETIGHLLRVGE